MRRRNRGIQRGARWRRLATDAAGIEGSSDGGGSGAGPAVEALAASEAFDHLVAKVVDYAIYLLDPDGRVTSWNAGAERLEGYPAAEILGRHVSTFYPPEALAEGAPARELAAAAAAGHLESEGWRVRRDGSRFWASAVLTTLRSDGGGVRGFLGITRDLSEQRRAEEELRSSEERFRLLVDGVRDYAIFMLDPEGIVTTWNSGAKRIKGYAAEEIVGRHLSTFYPPEALARDWPAHELAVASAEGRYAEEGWRVRRDGSRFWAGVVLTALRDARGELRGFAKVTRDLTELRAAEESLRQAHADLERRVEERTAALQAANASLRRLEGELRGRVEELADTDRRRNELLAMLGHELRNPLAPIRNAVTLLRQGGGDPALRAEATQVLDRQVSHLVRLVDDLLDVARAVQGKIELRRAPIELAAVVAHSVEAARPRLAAHGHHLTVDLPAETVILDADEVRLAQVITNLLVNAAIYTPEPGRIELTAAADASAVTVRVRDPGIGIAPELLPILFEPFVQGDRTLARSDAGLGIGLALVQRLTAMHGGTVSAHSAGPGTGSEFVVRLPRARSDSAAPAAAAPVTAATHRDVLVVDDNVDAATSMALLLRAWGHEARIAHDGFEAIAAVRERVPDIVLLDLGLPGMDGFDVALELRKLPGAEPLRIVAVTGYGMEEDRVRTAGAGFDLHLVKPVEPSALARLVGSNS